MVRSEVDERVGDAGVNEHLARTVSTGEVRDPILLTWRKTLEVVKTMICGSEAATWMSESKKARRVRGRMCRRGLGVHCTASGGTVQARGSFGYMTWTILGAF